MKKMMIEAFELKRQGYYKQAIEVYYKLLSETDDNIEILVELADLYFLMQNYSKANSYLEKVFDVDANNIQALEICKKIYLAEHNSEKALEFANKIYEIDYTEFTKLPLYNLLYEFNCFDRICELADEKDSYECKFILAKALYMLKKYKESLEVLNAFEDCSEQILLFRGKNYHKMGMIQEAREVYLKLKEVDLKDSESLYFVGSNYIDELELDKAIELLKKAISLKDDEAKYYYNLGQAYFLKGWIEEAQSSFNKAICLNPMEENYHYSLAYLLYRIGDYDNALVHLEGANESNLNSRILKLVIKSEKGDLALAKVELEKMLKENQKNETILFSLAKIYYKLDMFKQSKTLIEDVLTINSKSFEYQEFYVRLLLLLDELDFAKATIDELLEKYPRYYFAKVLEAEYYFKSANYDELFETAQDLIELDMNHYEGYYYNALALFEKEDVNFAIQSLKKAITLDVNNASLYVKMAEFYQAIGKYEDAFEYVKEASDIDQSAKNKELYMQLSSIVRKRALS